MDGLFIIDKPVGITSHDVVNRVRRIAGTRRVGHAGTLDPFATGVLLVCVGKATRLSQFLAGLDKEYIGTVRFGFATDTQDVTGKPNTPFVASDELSIDELRKTLGLFIGPQTQLPPMYSAKKIAGRRLYQAARAGEEVDRTEASITVMAIEPVDAAAGLRSNPDGTRDLDIRVRCSSGTYVRTLAHDIGGRVGTGAHLAALRRTAVGEFGIAAASPLDELGQLAEVDQSVLAAKLLTPSEALAHLPAIVISPSEVRDVENGREISSEASTGWDAARHGVQETAFVRLCDSAGRLVAVGQYRAGGTTVQPRVVLKT